MKNRRLLELSDSFCHSLSSRRAFFNGSQEFSLVDGARSPSGHFFGSMGRAATASGTAAESASHGARSADTLIRTGGSLAEIGRLICRI